MIRPVVGIGVWKRQLATPLGDGEVLHALADEYVSAVVRGGAVPVLLPGVSPEEVPTLLDLIDGLVLSGGGDVAPSAYGAEPDDTSSDVSEAADAFEFALIRHAEARDMPVLGISRGCQVLNVAFGGTLYQDVTSDDGVHRPMDGRSPEELRAARHEIVLSPGSTLAGIYSTERRSVNSLHHQGIETVADGFVATAVASDGLIEAIEATGTWTALGVQWHPERLDAQDELPLFRSFVDAVRSRIVEPGGVRFA